MIAENNIPEQDDNTSSSNSENDFKELDNEIEKVIRGEASIDEDNSEKKETATNIDSKTSQNSNIKKQITKNNTNKNNNINEINIMSNSKVNNKSSNFIINELNNIEEKFDFSYMKPNNPNNNLQRNASKNNYLNNKSIKKFLNQNNSSINLNPNLINYNSFFHNTINNNSNEFMPINNNIPKCGINYNTNINKMKEYDFLNNVVGHINENLSIAKNNVNNNKLFCSNINNYFYSSNFQQQQNLLNNMFNNLVITNQMINPININVQFNNNNGHINMSQNNQFYFRNNLTNNDINNNINNYISHYLKINNINNINQNINNIIKQNNEILMNKIENRLNNNLMDLIVNKIINNNPVLSNINNINSNSKDNNFEKTINNNNNIKQIISNCKPEKKSNKNSNKRKIFNPLSDSEKEKNIINLMDIFQCKDLRTTLMIKNIPNKYTLSSFLEEIGEYFKGTYDIFYLPIDYINKCNLGFAFINFVEPFHIILFYELYRGKKWKKFNSEKICELLFAKFQGRNELISHFEKGKVLSFDSEDKRPLILPVPTKLPNINIPIYYLDLFHKLYPYISYKIKNINNNKNNSLLKVFSINGNFNKN